MNIVKVTNAILTLLLLVLFKLIYGHLVNSFIFFELISRIKSRNYIKNVKVEHICF